MKSTGNDDLDYVLSTLEEGGASKAELTLARKRGQELITQHGKKLRGEAARFVMDTLKAEFGLTSPTLEHDDRNLRISTLSILEGQKDTTKRVKGLLGWIRGGKEREGD